MVRLASVLIVISMAMTILTTAGCQTTTKTRNPDVPVDKIPAIDVQHNPDDDGGMCLDANSTDNLLRYINWLEHGASASP